MTPEVRKRVDQIQHGIVPEGYKKTSIGIYPKEWAECRLGDIYTERKEAGNENLPLLMVSIHSGVSDGEVDEDKLSKKVKRIADKSQYKRAASGDLVFNMMRAWQGAVGTVRTAGMVSPAYIVAEPNDTVEPLYMDYYMKTNRMVRTIHCQSYGVTDFRLRLYWDAFASIQCILPSVPEQKKIAEIFSAQDKIIALQQKEIDELKKLKKAYLSKMFPKKGAKVPELRFNGFTEDWEQRKLYEMCGTFEYGLNVAAKEFDGKNKYIRITDIDDASREFLLSDLSSPDICLDGMSKYLLSRGDIVFARTGASVGKTYIYKETDGVVYFAGFLIRTKVNQDNDAEFVFQSTLSPSYEKYIRITSQRSGQPGVNAQEYGEYDLFAPSKEEQQRIGQFLRGIDNLTILHQRKLGQEQLKKKALMQLLLTGIVRV